MSTQVSIITGSEFENWYKKTLFLAKRGNLESELLLVDYINKLPNAISNQDATLFREFLDENDHHLLCWLMTFDPKETSNVPSHSILPPSKYLSLVKEIRANYLK